MNPDLDRLQPYPFERLRALLAGVVPPAGFEPTILSIGEPKHPTPRFIVEALCGAVGGLSSYPATAGEPRLREAIAAWVARRYAIPAPDPQREVLPVSGSREALFAFAQAVVGRRAGARVAMPNPFYQIYEGAALLAGADPLYLPTTADNGFRVDFSRVPDAEWANVQVAYVCSPGNPTGEVLTLEDWKLLFELSDRHGFVIAADECYSEIYFDDAPPLGALQAARMLGRAGYPRLVSFGSLSKRSSVPGLRSGFVVGDAALVSRFLLYRTYHGAALGPPIQAASVAAWGDEEHVAENRRLYDAKFRAVLPVIAAALPVERPPAAFYLWLRTPIDDAEFARRLYAESNVTVLPGSFLGRDVDGVNPGRGYVRVALVDVEARVVAAAHRIADLARRL
ncbi:MAG TPA: succinyldiaminopimelate transaminase [Burkholderiaceae bacterium]|nr:succinyldiaminopimelate transaminase [Burkholderiaceae bacterium]